LEWRGDSALSIYEILRKRCFEIAALLATITEDYGRVTMHGVRENLVEKQAEALGLKLEKIFIPKNCSNEEYEARMTSILIKYLEDEVFSVVFGDIFLEDVRKYREENLSKMGMKGIFPLWGENTFRLAEKFIDLGFKAIVACVDSRVLNKSFVGRIFDRKFLMEIPEKIDPCGENGEFHSFVFEGPIFQKTSTV
jgi:uncharacterized protein (TIGR00290 family)